MLKPGRAGVLVRQRKELNVAKKDSNMEQTVSDMAGARTDFAQARTDWAEDRTAMANERTFAGWMRTAFAAIGIGMAFHALFGKMQPSWVAKAIASLFILIGMCVMHLAQNRACAAFERLSAHSVNQPAPPRLRLLSWAVISGGMALLAAFWLLKIDG